MNRNDIFTLITSVASSCIVIILTYIGRKVARMGNDFRRFMAEHLYLLRIADWTKVNLTQLFDHLQLTPTEPPPLMPLDQRRK